MAEKILTKFQKEVLKRVGESELSHFFIWSGETALSFNYLRHRISAADLDFLSTDLFPNEYILTEIRKLTKNLEIKKLKSKKFNR